VIQIWHVLVFYFDWPYGAVYGNVWAIIPCGLIAGLWGRRKLIRWNRRREAKDEERHQDMKAHVSREHQLSREHLENHLAKRKR
jgi:hypothetical protein